MGKESRAEGGTRPKKGDKLSRKLKSAGRSLPGGKCDGRRTWCGEGVFPERKIRRTERGEEQTTYAIASKVVPRISCRKQRKDTGTTNGYFPI